MGHLRTGTLVVVSLAFGLSACIRVPAQGVRCGAGRDLVVQALERITPQSDPGSFEDALQLLEHAVSECSELGDAWYYRSFVEQHLGHDSLAKYALDKARFVGSEELDQGLNPLALSTPASRFHTGSKHAINVCLFADSSRPRATEMGACNWHR